MPVEENVCTTSYARGPARPLLELTIGDLLHAHGEPLSGAAGRGFAPPAAPLYLGGVER